MSPSVAKNPLRVVIAGAGMIGEVHRRAALLAGAEIIGVVERDIEYATQVAERWGIPGAYDSVAQGLEAQPDVLHICTPNSTHGPSIRAALDAGVHIVCEKPLCLDSKEADEFVAISKQKGLVTGVPYAYRYHPLVREIRARYLGGDMGKLHLIHGTYLQDWLLNPNSSSWRVSPAEGGQSRAFADIGSHWCDLVEWVTGERIGQLNADLTIAIKQRPIEAGETFTGGVAGDVPCAPVTTEDIATMVFRTASGVPGTVTISQVSAGRKNRLWFEIDAATQSACFDQENPETIWLGGETQSTTIARGAAGLADDTRRITLTPSGHVQGWEACFENFIKDVYSAVNGEPQEGMPTFADGARSLHIIDAVLKSSTTRAWTEVT
ncbi:MAG: Gfo/Idh/MocA family oxidoreductase [Propionibacteriaceae bacterium]|nr:Gfo/Idh/MocA family oxidoreductase [Propionibacteriaceae bacterium]